ncbi:hypothetical protein R1sor_001714 [Riccia sorocarpa]|uniref:Cystinosin homolog n=1 Tax=Riccia sorocarpa TaxID=122646 RepID=A0ABD3GZV4_9MARC
MAEEDAAWHSTALYIIYLTSGWFAFAVWSISFYPQVILNYRRKSVAGLSFDYVVFNFTKHSSYLIYNASLYFSPVVQRQYHEKYGKSELIPVAPSDVAFSTHAVLLISVILFQVLTYEGSSQKISKLAITITTLAWGSALVLVLIAWPKGDWLWLVSGFNIIQVVMTGIKYIPQALLNYQRKSTIGWSIVNIILDLSGGTANIFQMGIQSIDQHSLENFTGNVGKLGLSFESIFFDIVFVIQHYLLYREREEPKDIEYEEIEEADPETPAHSSR